MNLEQARRRIRLRDLETLAAVVQAGGMRKAAHSLHLSQAAISKAVRTLEDAVGVPLLERGRRGVTATVFGAVLVRRSGALLDDLDAALRELESLADPHAGEVRLGCMETLHAGLVGAAVARTLERHPRMRFVLESGQAPDLVDHFLRQRLVDFVVARPLTTPLPPEVHGEPLLFDQLRVVAGPAHPLSRRRKLGIADLADAHWILSRNEIMRESPVSAAFDAAGLAPPSRVVVSGSLNFRYSLLATGRFVTCVPHSMLPFGDAHRALRILPVELPVWRTPTMILSLRERSLGPAARLFLDRLRALAAQIGQPAPMPDRRRGR